MDHANEVKAQASSVKKSEKESALEENAPGKKTTQKKLCFEYMYQVKKYEHWDDVLSAFIGSR